LNFETEEEDLGDFFDDCGKIRKIRIVKRDGQSRGFGYIEFQTTEAVQKALTRSGAKIDGRTIKVDIAYDSRRGGGANR